MGVAEDFATDVLAALNALSEADKNDASKIWAALYSPLKTYMSPDIPVGTVKLFDANNAGGGGTPSGASGAWVDDSTLPGWYACISANSVHGCPDMVDKFVMGKVVDNAGSTGGSNTHTISSAELPTHTHAIDHDHAAFNSGYISANHTHSVSIGSHYHAIGTRTSAGGSSQHAIQLSINSQVDSTYNTNSTNLGTKTSGGVSANHYHSINVPNYTGSSGDGGFANDSFDNRPAYYSMIFIRKCG